METLAASTLAIDGHLLVRSAHVIAAMLLVGGAVLAWAAWLGVRPGDGGSAAAARLAVRYEWLAWGALGVLVATGIGNLGVFGEALPAPDSRWGRALTVKLGLVLLLLLLSAVRVLALVRASGGSDEPRDARATRAVRRLYGAARRWRGRGRRGARAWVSGRSHCCRPIDASPPGRSARRMRRC